MSTPRGSFWLTWINGTPVIKFVPRGQRLDDAPVLCEATEEDRRLMYQGHILYDGRNDPARLAWDEHARNGGD